jgi:hypothetical protein
MSKVAENTSSGSIEPIKYCEGITVALQIGVTRTPVIFSVLALYTSMLIREEPPFVMLRGKLVIIGATSNASIMESGATNEFVCRLSPFV